MRLRTRRLVSLVFLCALCVLCGGSCLHAAAPPSAQSVAPTQAPYQYFRLGSPTNVHVHPRAGYALMGGGTDLDAAFRWLCTRADGGDFLVLRASGTDDYNPYIQPLCRLNSVATLIIPSRAAANHPFVATAITNAAAIFISGGDQGKYIGNWAHSPVETALRDAVRRGVPIGGTSAGLAVLGQYIYSAQNDKPDDADLTSGKALADPFYRQVVIAPDLLGIPVLRGLITDTHFDTRHREGRLLVFMARILASGKTSTIRAIGVDERNAVLVDPDGHAQVIGKQGGEADFYQATGRPEQCEPGKPLIFDSIQKQIIPAGKTFNLNTWHGDGPAFGLAVHGTSIIAGANAPSPAPR